MFAVVGREACVQYSCGPGGLGCNWYLYPSSPYAKDMELDGIYITGDCDIDFDWYM